MRASFFLITLSVVLFCSPARAVDYAKVDRTIRKEPAYQQSPKYALLLFGPQAQLRVWVVLDGETVYLDRNANGDLTDKDERFARLQDCRDVEISDPDGKTRYLIKSVNIIGVPLTVKEPAREHLDPASVADRIRAENERKDKGQARTYLHVDVEIKGPLSYRQYCGAELGGRPSDAPIAHFHGPLTMGLRTINGKVPEQLVLVTGDKPTDLFGHVGTLNDKYGCWVVVWTHNGAKSAFPEGVRPVVDVEFPPKAPGGPPVRKRYVLDKFC